jgi:hypothetical protein
MAKLITVEKARKEVKRLQEYIDLVENYEADTIEKWIIKEYAYTNSLNKVTEKATEARYIQNGMPITKEYVTSVINGKASDKLHKLLKSGYNQRVKAIKNGEPSF